MQRPPARLAARPRSALRPLVKVRTSTNARWRFALSDEQDCPHNYRPVGLTRRLGSSVRTAVDPHDARGAPPRPPAPGVAVPHPDGL